MGTDPVAGSGPTACLRVTGRSFSRDSFGIVGVFDPVGDIPCVLPTRGLEAAVDGTSVDDPRPTVGRSITSQKHP
jgi:hypothetical protein